MVEAAEINSALMALKTCLQARAQGKKRIPFRESLLTRVLRDALISEDAMTACVTCVSPCSSHLELSLNTLRTAANLMGETKRPAVEEEEVKEKGIIKGGGPSKWDHDALVKWVAGQPFGEQVCVPATTTGAGDEVAREASCPALWWGCICGHTVV